METLEKLLETLQKDTDRNNRIIQMALREIDTILLIRVVWSLKENQRKILYRNVSKRVYDLLQEDLKRLKADKVKPDAKVKDAQNMYKEILEKKMELVQDSTHPAPKELPAIKLDSEKDIIETFKKLQRHISMYGVISIEGITDKISNPVMKKGLEYLIDGWGPLFVKSLLERIKENYINKVSKQMDMVLEGLDAISEDNMEIGVEERLKSYIIE